MASIHKEYTLKESGSLTQTDRAIREYIENNHMEYYDGVLAQEDRFPVFLKLSVLRTGLLSWYDFKPDAELLEIGAGFGGLTGLLCERCGHVTATERSLYRAEAAAQRWSGKENLDIYAGEWSDMDFGGGFDYIVLTGLLERVGKGSGDRRVYAAYLEKLSRLLTPGGTILLSVENRFGLRYFCGVTEPHTHRSFDGINCYPHGTNGRSFSRKELEDIVSLAGFAHHKFYYPLPDYRLPQLIYTDGYLPEKNLKERLLPYYVNEKHLIALEADLYNDIAENSVFPFFANSFLVECVKDGTAGNVVYAALSTDRGMERSFATAITADGTVRKTPLFAEGEANARALLENLEDLRAHGVPVLDGQLENGALIMPFVKLPMLSNCLKELMPINITRFQEILDELYAFILQASEPAETGNNALAARILARTQDEEEKKKILSLDWGPVLEKAYMELIPLNCFYDEENRRFLFFDQEFVRENYPANYVLFRAIHYIYCFTPGAEEYLPQKALREKYGLEETWEYYRKEETRFLDEVRNRATYRQFYQWTKVDRKEIRANIEKLSSEEEKIAGYRVSDRMKKIWKVELGLLDAVDAICKRHGLAWFIIHGTLLGAVRHKGFIPWDDDLDIGMLREDYDRFLEAAEEELKPPFCLQNMWSKEDCFFGGLTRIRNEETTGIQAKELGHKSGQGIWIDILPLDVCTEDEKKLDKKVKKISYYYRLFHARVYGKEEKRFGGMDAFGCMTFKLLACLYPKRTLCRRLDAAMRLYTEEESGQLATFTGYGKPIILNREDFQDTVPLDFEQRKLPAPAGYENYLFTTMGKDYMKYPPEEERKPKHRGIFDPDRPYADYVKKLTGMFEGVKGKEIILFGAGLMFDDYMKKWGGRYRPAFTVDNDENKWGRFRRNIEIKDPKAILEVPSQKRRLIICSYYYPEIEKQLQKMGITDYQVYVQHLEWILQSEEREI